MEETLTENVAVPQRVKVNGLLGRVSGSILRNNPRLWMSGVLLASDMLSLGISMLVGLKIRYALGGTLAEHYQGIFLLLSATLAVAFYRRQLYPAIGMHYVQELREIASTTTFGFVIVFLVTYLLKTATFYTRLTLAIVWLVSLVLIPTARYLLRKLFVRLKLWGEPVAIIGDQYRETQLAAYFTINLALGLRPVTFQRDRRLAGEGAQHGLLLTLDELRQFAREHSIRTALVVINDLNNLDGLVNRYRPVFERVILIKGRNGSYSLNSMKSLDLSGVLGLQVMNNLLNPWSQVFKRVEDVIVAILGLAFLAPFFAVTALLIKLRQGGSIYYRQIVLGRDGKTFEMLKFQTMCPNAQRLLDELLERDPEARGQWDRYQKLRDDPRITPVGRLLRKFSLDELPQLWNVLHGEMSLVGPRPMMVSQRAFYGDAFEDYVQVSPGMTGLWQVSGRNERTFAERAELDREYIQRWSAWLDVFIMLKTVKIVFWHPAAF